ncbi:MAG: AraC family transcriptional regulator [Prevotella sp.]|nr:AraC family transcriptional regulator [Prevotella sp.]
MGLGRVQLYRKVKALTGSTPVELLRLARLERGRQLLKTTDMTISQVAYEVGFATPSYFTTCFKQQYGMYPNDVRI